MAPPPDDTRGPLVVGFGWATTALCIIVAGLRMHSRFRKRAHGWDDFMIYVALLFVLACGIINIFQVQSGIGRHQIYLSRAELPTILMWTVLTEFFSSIGVCFIKVSVCLFVLRFIRGTYRSLRLVIWAMIFIISTTTTALSLVILLQCQPLAKAWNKELPGKCLPVDVETRLARATSVFGTITDILCVIVPIFVLVKLKIDLRTKIAIGAILALGFVTAGFAIAKTVMVQLVAKDFTWDAVPVLLCTMFEMNLGFIVACLPTIRPAYLALSTKVSSTLRTLRHSNTTGSATTGSVYQNTIREEDTSSEIHILPELPDQKNNDGSIIAR